MRFRKTFCFVAGLTLACALALDTVQAQAPAMPPARVEVATAELREMAPVIEVTGTVVSLSDSRIATEVQGVLTWLADVGDAVDAGDTIARIDPRLMSVQLRRAEANVARLEADYRYREQQLKRTEDLAATNSVSETLLDESRAERDQAMHQLADARAQLERAEGDLERTRIRAAFGGHVTERLASIGEYLDVGEDVVRLVDTHRKEIALPAPIALTRYIRPGMSVTARSDGDIRQYEVRAVVPVGDEVSRQVEVRLNATDSDWMVGTAVQISLPRDEPVVSVAVPRDALVERGGEAFVFVVKDDGTAEQVNARIQSLVGLWVGIAAGIEAGDRVIVRGAERLAPGSPVEIIESGDAD